MPQRETTDLIERYFAAFNARDLDGLLGLLDDDVVHDMRKSGLAGSLLQYPTVAVSAPLPTGNNTEATRYVAADRDRTNDHRRKKAREWPIVWRSLDTGTVR